jgi:hypothetical protein
MSLSDIFQFIKNIIHVEIIDSSKLNHVIRNVLAYFYCKAKKLFASKNQPLFDRKSRINSHALMPHQQTLALLNTIPFDVIKSFQIV